MGPDVIRLHFTVLNFLNLYCQLVCWWWSRCNLHRGGSGFTSRGWSKSRWEGGAVCGWTCGQFVGNRLALASKRAAVIIITTGELCLKKPRQPTRVMEERLFSTSLMSCTTDSHIQSHGPHSGFTLDPGEGNDPLLLSPLGSAGGKNCLCHEGFCIQSVAFNSFVGHSVSLWSHATSQFYRAVVVCT